MLDIMIQRQLNKTIIDFKTNKINKNNARCNINNLLNITRNQIPKGHKRRIKQDIFTVKKTLRL